MHKDSGIATRDQASRLSDVGQTQGADDTRSSNCGNWRSAAPKAALSRTIRGSSTHKAALCNQVTV